MVTCIVTGVEYGAARYGSLVTLITYICYLPLVDGPDSAVVTMVPTARRWPLVLLKMTEWLSLNILLAILT